MGIFVMIFNYIINGVFSVLFHDILSWAFRFSVDFFLLALFSFFFQIGFYLFHSPFHVDVGS